MKRKIKWHKMKCKVTNFIKVAIVVLAFMFAFCSFVYLAETQLKALFTFVISVILLILFGVANKGVLM